jgi:hypothetical protein
LYVRSNKSSYQIVAQMTSFETKQLALSPAVQRAVEACCPEYLTLDPEAQELCRANWSAEIPEGFLRYLYVHELGKTEDQVSSILNYDETLSADEERAINRLMQEIRGIGDDYFSWNECLPEGATALSYHTVRDYVCGEMGEDHAAGLSGEWARFLDGGDLRYATLDDLPSFIEMHLERASLRLISELIPHTYVAETHHSELDQSQIVSLSMHLNAHGREDLHEALSDVSRQLVDAQYRAFCGDAMEGQPAVWLCLETDWAGYHDQQGVFVVFTGPKAMGKVRLRHFLKDCADHAGDLPDLKQIALAEVDALEARIREAYAELSKSYGFSD